MTADRSQPLEVWKFGGASLADGQAIRRAAARIAAHQGPLVLVASALGGITDLLLEGATHAVEGRADAAARVASVFRDRHRTAAAVAIGRGRALAAVHKAIDASAEEYRELCRAVAVLRHIEPRTRDALVARGERLAASLLSAALVVAGRPATLVDALDLVHTDDGHGGAVPLLAETTRLASRVLKPLLTKGLVPVVPGFIGRAPDGSVATLGRGGSDLTATLLGRGLGARRVVLWKDVPGILTADPKLVTDARLIPELHHQEAAEVAHYGAKVLHPRALIPIAGTRIVLHVRSFVHPDRPGTEVSARHVLPGYPVKALAILPGQAVVTVAGKGMVGVHGIAARTFAAVDAERLSVSTIFQGSSESSIGFTVPAAEADRAVKSVSRAFRHEIDTGVIDGVSARKGVAVIAVVGEGMAGTPGIAARVFSALESGGINIVAIAQGSSERNISFVVAGDDAAEAARRVHAAFQLSKIGGGRAKAVSHTDVVLLGFGRVGRALADQIAALDGRRLVRIVGLLDRSGYVFDARGLSRSRLLKLARLKDAGQLLADLGGTRATASEGLAMMAGHAVSRPIVVDVTSEETGDMLLAATQAGFDLVLANKKPLAVPWEGYARLMTAAASGGRQIRYEATVGAGLPIIDTFNKLDETGDRVLRIDGCVSGTLMFVLSEVSAGRPFSGAVVEAVARGYAEPDPREDLSGQDAARKGLILARMLGYRGPAAAADNLVPEPMRGLSLAAFMEQLSSLDASWRERVEAERTKGRVLRYVVSATSRGATAKLVAVPASSPMGAATGTRNIITFVSRRYRDEPIVISGPGAGAAVTAAGILNDICALSLK
ncbi:MAG TPA: aspartate kinase [Vicinamibacterales bacterium]|nr:aspartate kinase [Vicinamibacterales bacterium]